jgi:XTP/dITP diphosphohydrolase
MLTLATSNPAKYAPFAPDLERMRLALAPPSEHLPEIQSLNFIETLTAKARAAAAMFGRPVLVDDTGLRLEAYPAFPGPLTATVLRSLGVSGLRRLLTGTSDRAVMECHLGCFVDGALRHWTGAVPGWIDLTRSPRDERMPLSDLFIPDPAAATDLAMGDGGPAHLLHRARALASLERSIFELHLETAPPGLAQAPACAMRAGYDCPFCAEFENDQSGIFATLMGSRLPSRILYEDEHFLVMPPLGEFMAGGLLLLTREHILSLAHLPTSEFDHLERLLKAIQRVLVKQWGVPPLIFEHGPAPEAGKGVCCVDHAHLNIFPAPVSVHPHLAERMHFSLADLAGLIKLRRAEFGYLFVQENDGTRRAYDGRHVPTQLVRRIITTQMGLPERWHWRDYLGQEELVATYQALQGQIQL